MKIFLGWSGPVALELSEALRHWLPAVLPNTQSWLSEEDIAKGAEWSPELWKNLKTANFGIICVVPGIESEPWISFEAGALACAGAAKRVSPFLLGVEP